MLSLIVPFLNEQDNLPALHERTGKVLDHIDMAAELIFVDDGSSDRSLDVLIKLQQNDKRIRIIQLSRNFGHQAAVSAGLAKAKGDAVAVLDADLQDPPEIIPKMIAKWQEGYDVVYGVRKNRKENCILTAAYFLFYRIFKHIVPFDVPVDAGDFALMDKRVLATINNLPEKKRFVRGLRGWVGFRQYGLEYERDARQAGTSKYSWAKLIALALDGIIAYSTLPLRIAIWMGAASSFGGMLYLIFVIYAKLFRNSAPSGWASIICIILVLGGVQLLVLGIIGEYIGRIYEEVKSRPTYIINKTYEGKL